MLRTWVCRCFRGGKWKLVAGAGLIAVIALVAVLMSGRLGPKDRTWERIRAEGIMRVGMDASFPPFEMIDPNTGQPIGLDVDLAIAVGEELGGIQVQFLNLGFDGLYDSLLAGRIDAIISALPVDRTWTEDVRYSQPYFEAGLVMVTRRELSEQFKRPEDLVGRRVAIEWGSEGDAYGRQLSRRAGALELQSYSTPIEALEAVQRGMAEVSLVDAVSAYQFISKTPELCVVGAPLTEVSYAIAVRRSSPVLAKAIDEALTRLKQTHVLDELMAKWF